MNSSEVIKIAITHLKQGNVLLYPTDTIWGLGCDPFNETAINKVFDIKQRDKNKAFILLVDSLQMLSNYVTVSNTIIEILGKAVRPTTIIFHQTTGLPDFVLDNKDSSIAIRIVDHPFISDLISQFGKPLVSTSANISGDESPKSFESIHSTIRESADYIIPETFDTNSNANSSDILVVNNNGQVSWIRKY